LVDLPKRIDDKQKRRNERRGEESGKVKKWRIMQRSDVS
jgi:hypothetical protein